MIREEKRVFKVTTKLYPDSENELWAGNTGASCHITNDGYRISQLVEHKGDKVIVDIQRKFQVTKKAFYWSQLWIAVY